MRPVWVLDADGIEFHNKEIYNLYRTRVVDEFIYNERKLGVSAARGLGKTFLLKAKRNAMQNKSGVFCLPTNSMVDTLSSPKFMTENYKFFEDYNNWKYLWKVSLIISIIKELIENQYIDKDILDTLPEEINNLFKHGLHRASEYFNYIIDFYRKDVNIIFEKSYSLDLIIRSVNFSVCMFIDRVDQALSIQSHQIKGQSKMSTGPRNASFWQYAQLALADVSYEILSINPHIKIYYSIRNEAFVDAAQISYVYQNAREYICDLKYSSEELKGMYNQYISYEKDENLYSPFEKETNPSKAFVGIEEIKCTYIEDTKEPVFDYILRHTFLRPRDIMDICYHLYVADLKLYKGDELEDKIKSIVNFESQMLLEIYISSTEQFLLNIKREHIEYICQLININVMDLKYIKYICRRLNENFKIDGGYLCQYGCESCEELHPFCQLYNVGLVGALWENRADKNSIRFLDTSSSLIHLNNHILPKSKYYFLHPCLSSKAEHIRKNRIKGQGFTFIRNILVSQGTEVDTQKFKSIKNKIEVAYKEIHDERIFISSTCFDLSDERKQIDNTLSDLGYDVVRSDADDFKADLNGIHSHDHCIMEALECKYMIFIVGKRYGSKYAGSNFDYIKEEIKQQSNGKITEPSISLMEYYIARKNGKKIFVFVDDEVYNERQIYKVNKMESKQYIPVFADKTEVFNIIDFVTHQKVDNWFRRYNSLFNLDELIRITFESQN